MYRIVGLLLTAVIPLSAHLFEVSYDGTPFESNSTIAGSVRNVSGKPILFDLRAVAFAFGPNGVFLGYGATTIKGPIPISQPRKFRIMVDADNSSVERFYLQLEGGNTVLSYEVNNGPRPEPWPGTSDHFTQAPSRDITNPQTVRGESPRNCTLLVLGMATDQSSKRLEIRGRLRNISSDEIPHGFPEIRVTLYDSVGAYFSEDSRQIGDCYSLDSGAECAFEYGVTFSAPAKTYEIEFMTARGAKIPHCLR